jgi:hypothetical protein
VLHFFTLFVASLLGGYLGSDWAWARGYWRWWQIIFFAELGGFIVWYPVVMLLRLMGK